MNQRLLGRSDDIFEKGNIGDSVVHLIELEESILSPSMMIGVSDKDGGKGDDDDEEDESDDYVGNEDDDEDDAEKDSNDDIITIIIETNEYVYKHVYRYNYIHIDNKLPIEVDRILFLLPRLWYHFLS